MNLDQQAAVLTHRQWPVPDQPWIMRQGWHDLLFMHWPLPAAEVRALVPPTLPVDTGEGDAWISVVPFRMRGVTLRGAPAVPWLSAFPELNVRTYVTLDDKPGVYFFSLDAGNIAAVWAARRWYHLPYFHAEMLIWEERGTFSYVSHRTHRGAPAADLMLRYRPTGAVYEASLGSLESWLTDRYSLYTTDRRGRPLRAEIMHQPWPLQPAEAEVDFNTMARAAGLTLPGRPPLLQFSRHIDMVAWRPALVAEGEC